MIYLCSSELAHFFYFQLINKYLMSMKNSSTTYIINENNGFDYYYHKDAGFFVKTFKDSEIVIDRRIGESISVCLERIFLSKILDSLF